MKTLSLELELVLPHDSTHADPCVGRLLETLRGRPGILDAHVGGHDAAPADAVPTLCVHFDPDKVSVARVEGLVHAAGADLATRYGHVAMPIEGLRHERHARLVEGMLAREPGVLHVVVAFGTANVAIEFDPERTHRDAIMAAIGRAGLRPLTAPQLHDHEHAEGEHARRGEHEHDHGADGSRAEIIASVLCGVLTLAAWQSSRFAPPWAQWSLAGAAYLAGGWFTLREVAVAVRARRLEIDFLMLVAALGAAALGEWIEGGLLLFLFTLGHALEGYAMSRARGSIEALAKLVPQTATMRAADGIERELAVAALVVGDRVIVKPHCRIPADGMVVAGTGCVDQAPITGESVPVEKRPVADPLPLPDSPDVLEAEHRVLAGTVNGASALEVIVLRPATDSALARVVEMVTEAETQRSPIQLLTDRFERTFVPAILAVVVLLLFAWLVVDEPFAASFYRAMAVLVAASPCALAIATPSAVLAGIARAARGGVLVKGGAHLESLGAIHAIAFDKTGTLTEGRPRLTDVAPAPGVGETELLVAALAVELRSDHPLASAIVSGARARIAREAPEAVDVEAIIGHGVQGRVDGVLVRVGKPALFERDGRALPDAIARSVVELRDRGCSVVVVGKGDALLGVLGVRDKPREAARAVIAELFALGVKRTIMLSGDHQAVAEAMARHVGITEARGDLLPHDKVTFVAELARKGGHVAMVGDGVNDAPAMAKATVGIAMGAGGSDVALETADVALMGDDLRGLPFAVGLSRACRRTIRQNLWFSLGMVALLVPATIFGIAGIGVAVILHEGSTVMVVANALALLAYRAPRPTAIAPP